MKNTHATKHAIKSNLALAVTGDMSPFSIFPFMVMGPITFSFICCIEMIKIEQIGQTNNFFTHPEVWALQGHG